MHLNVGPFLLHLSSCFTTLILYKQVDFGQPEFPIAMMRPRYAHYDKSACVFVAQQIQQTEETSSNTNTNICEYVLQNYQTKGTRCVAVVSVYPPEGFGKADIYWYLNYYWSRPENKRNNSEYMFAPLFPTNIHIQTIISRESFENTQFTTTDFTELRKEWECFLIIPVVALIPNSSVNATFLGEIGIIFYGTSAEYTGIKIKHNSGLNSVDLAQWTENLRKTKLQLNFVGNKYLHTLASFLHHHFNQSRVSWNRLDSLSQINYRKYARPDFVHGTNEYVTIAGKTNLYIVTCSGLRPIINLSFYVDPYDTASWACLLTSILCVGSVLLAFPHIRKRAIRIPEILYYILVEQPYKLDPNLNGTGILIVFGSLSTMAVVLTNGYKGIITTSVVKPFERSGLKSLESALQNNYKILAEDMPNKNKAFLRRYCCSSKEGLSLQVDPTTLLGQKSRLRFMSCRDLLSLHSKLRLITHFRNRTKQTAYHVQLLKNGNLSGMDGPEDPREKLLIKLVQHVDTVECHFENFVNEVLDCNKTIYVGSEMDSYILSQLQKFNYSLPVENPIYNVPFNSNLFQDELILYEIYPLNIARQLILRSIRAFGESGVMSMLETRQTFMEKESLTFRLLRILFCSRYGSGL